MNPVCGWQNCSPKQHLLFKGSQNQASSRLEGGRARSRQLLELWEVLEAKN